MRRAIGISVLAHVAVVTIAYFGLPHFTEPLEDQPMVTVDVAVVSELTNAPPPRPQPAKPTPPAPPPPRAETPPPPPPPPPPPRPPEPQVAAVPPPKAEPLPEPLPKPAPPKPVEAKPEPKPVQAPPPPPAPRVLDEIKPTRKPKPVDDPFASVLRTVENLKQAPQVEKPKEPAKTPPKPSETFEQQIAKALSTSQRPFDAAQQVSVSEIDLVRQQIAQCWNLPAGAKDAENLVIEIKVVMNSDGKVREARIADQGRMASDTFFRAAAESAIRAVLNPKCQPLKLPPEKYAQWQTMTLNFNPKHMLGQ
jgi:hypothetical protein